MAQQWTAGELVELVHQYYPANLNEEGFKSEQAQRLLALLARIEIERAPLWNRFIERLRSHEPKSIVWDLSRPLNVQQCHRVRVYVPGTLMARVDATAVMACLSVMAPLYIVFTSYEHVEGDRTTTRVSYEPRPETIDLERMLERNIEETFGFTRLPNEVLFTPVPDLAPGNRLLGQATLADCLFTDNRW